MFAVETGRSARVFDDDDDDDDEVGTTSVSDIATRAAAAKIGSSGTIFFEEDWKYPARNGRE